MNVKARHQALYVRQVKTTSAESQSLHEWYLFAASVIVNCGTRAAGWPARQQLEGESTNILLVFKSEAYLPVATSSIMRSSVGIAAERRRRVSMRMLLEIAVVVLMHHMHPVLEMMPVANAQAVAVIISSLRAPDIACQVQVVPASTHPDAHVGVEVERHHHVAVHARHSCKARVKVRWTHHHTVRQRHHARHLRRYPPTAVELPARGVVEIVHIGHAHQIRVHIGHGLGMLLQICVCI